MMKPACEVNEKGTTGKNDGNEIVEEGSSPPLDLDPNEVIEADEETLPMQKRTGKTPNGWRPLDFGTRSYVYDTNSTE